MATTGHENELVDVLGLKSALLQYKTTVSDNKLDATLKGANNGLAELNESGKIPSSQLPSYVDDVIEGYLYNEVFYEDELHTTSITGESGKIYVDLTDNKSYRWTGTTYICVGSLDITGIKIGNGNTLTPSNGVITIPEPLAASGSNINSVGTPNVTTSTNANGVTTFTFNYLKGQKGDAGENGNCIWTTTTAPTSPNYTFTISNLVGPAGRVPQVGDLIIYSYYRYTVSTVSTTTVLGSPRVSIRGASGASAAVFTASANGLVPKASSENSATAESSSSVNYLCSDAVWRPLPTGAFCNGTLAPATSGTSGQILTSAGSGNAPTWENDVTTTDVANLSLPAGTLDPNGLLTYLTNKAEKVTIVNVASGTTTLSPDVDKYYNIAGEVGTLAITLPSMSNVTTLLNFVISFTTGSSPNITITASGSTISYFKGYSIDASTNYELNCLYNGTKWIIAYGIYE